MYLCIAAPFKVVFICAPLRCAQAYGVRKSLFFSVPSTYVLGYYRSPLPGLVIL
jgi:hypothetical protein